MLCRHPTIPPFPYTTLFRSRPRTRRRRPRGGPHPHRHRVTHVTQTGATVTVGLHSLRQEGEVLALELSFTPHFRGDGEYSIYEMHDRNSITTVLNDRSEERRVGKEGE